MATYGGVYYSDDLGESWSLCQGGLPDIPFHAVAVSTVNPEIVFAGGYDYETGDVYRSTDGGGIWDELDVPRGWTIEIVCDPVDQDIVYMSKGS